MELNDYHKNLVQKIMREIQEKSKVCSNLTYKCTLPCLPGHNYCQKHILLYDSRLKQFGQCLYEYKNGDRCSNIASLQEDRGSGKQIYCYEHRRKQQLKISEQLKPKASEIETTDSLLVALSKHVLIKEPEEEVEVPRPDAGTPEFEVDVESLTEEDEHVCTDPFVPHESVNSVEAILAEAQKLRDPRTSRYNEAKHKLPRCFGSTMRVRHDALESDESVDSDDDNVLQNAEIFTDEEVISIARKKSLKLREHLLEQFSTLKRKSAKNHRQYLKAVEKEGKKYGSIYKGLRTKPKDRVVYKRLRALAAIGHRNIHEKAAIKTLRQKIKAGRPKLNPKQTSDFSQSYEFGPCLALVGGVLCKAPSIPLLKYCRDHVLMNEHQLIYRKCGAQISENAVCEQPVLNLDNDSRCVVHRELKTKNPSKQTNDI